MDTAATDAASVKDTIINGRRFTGDMLKLLAGNTALGETKIVNQVTGD